MVASSLSSKLASWQDAEVAARGSFLLRQRPALQKSRRATWQSLSTFLKSAAIIGTFDSRHQRKFTSALLNTKNSKIEKYRLCWKI
jgi:hypothetical protein